MKEVSLVGQQKICIDILKWLDEFCKKEDIKYYIGYGTLLGAVRHKGFIPWDDDIDILMFRSEYNKFISKFSSQKYELFDFNKPGYYVGVTKIADKNTFLQQKIPQAKRNIGVSVDLFILDYVPNDELEFKKLADTLVHLKNILIRQRTWLNGVRLLSSPKSLLNLFCFSLKNKVFSIEKTRKKMNKLTQSLSSIKSDYVGCVTGASAYTYKERYNVEWFTKTVDVEFEGKKYPAPYKYEEYLSYLYGDYMQLPPEEKRFVPTDSKFYYK